MVALNLLSQVGGGVVDIVLWLHELLGGAFKAHLAGGAKLNLANTHAGAALAVVQVDGIGLMVTFDVTFRA